MESISWESRPGNTHLPRIYSLARGTHTFRTSTVSPGVDILSAHPVSRPGETPTFRAPQSRPKWTPTTSATGFREPHNKPAWLRETPYTTIYVFPVDSVLYMTKYPAYGGYPIWLGCLTPTLRTNLFGVSPAEKGSQITCYYLQVTYLLSFLLNYTTHLVGLLIPHIFGYPSIPPDDYITLYLNIHNMFALYKNARETESFYLSPQGSPPVRREFPQRHAVSMRPRSTYYGLYYKKYLSPTLWPIQIDIHLSNRYKLNR